MNPRPLPSFPVCRWHRLALACLLSVAGPVPAAEPASGNLLPGITFHAESRANPPNRLFIAEVDLAHPKLRLHVAPGGPDPDGPGPWETTLLQPTRIAAREGFDFVLNGDFFLVREGKEKNTPRYAAGAWGSAVGPAVSNGRTWSSSAKPVPCLVVAKDHSVKIAVLTNPGPSVREAIAGNTILLKDGAAVPHQDQVRHPRTAVGLLDRGGNRLVILVVDGRKPGVAAGMTCDELAAEMLRLGCRQALNLDGGGSSLMAVREPSTGAFRILNAPTDGSERPVANVLGISVK